MKHPLMLSIFVGLLPLFGQEDVPVFGYYESQYMGREIGDNTCQLYSNKLRIDLEGDLSDRVTFGANINYITYNGMTAWNILELLDPFAAAEVQGGTESHFIVHFQDRNYLDNAFLKLAFDKFDLTAGKQQVSLGTGYAWNPLDIFNVKDLVDPTYEQPGHNAVRIDLPLTLDYMVTALFSPEDTWENSDKMLTVKGRLGHFDYSLTAAEKLWVLTDFTQVDPGTDYFIQLPERRRLYGFSAAGELLGLGLWSEYGYNVMESSNDFYELVIGSDYTIDSGTYLMAEWFHYSIGKTAVAEYGLNDWMRSYYNQRKAISKDQLYLYLMHPLTDLLMAGLSTIYNISDGSLALVPMLIYSFSDNVEIMGYLSYNNGEMGSVFASDQGPGGILRARIYF